MAQKIDKERNDKGSKFVSTSNPDLRMHHMASGGNSNPRIKGVPKLIVSLVGIILISAVGYAGAGFFFPNKSPLRPFAVKEPVQLDSLPLHLNDTLIKPLRSLVNADLQRSLERIVSKNKKWAALAAENKLGIGLVDMRDPYNVKFARINGGQMMYAASLPKIAVLLAAMQSIEDGSLEETPALRADMRQMIARSDNNATTRVIDLVGFDKIAEVLQDPRYEFYDEDYGGGLWVGKRYAHEGLRVGDPIKNLSHAASATQVCRYYYLLAYGQLINEDRSREMLTYLGNPELHHKFVNTLDRVAPRAKVFRKSGSWHDYHSDSVLVWGPTWRRYILVALVEDPGGESMMRELMLEVDRMLNPQQS